MAHFFVLRTYKLKLLAFKVKTEVVPTNQACLLLQQK